MRRVPGLDVIRGIAVGLVLLRHATGFGGGGLVGVVIFFALSGYLMTGVLARGIEARGSVDYRTFYRNRATRLVPALVTMLAVYLVVHLIFGTNQVDTGTVLISLLIGATYVMDLLPNVTIAPGLSHLWTLAIEEQFYLLWPAFLTWAIRARRMPRRVVGATAAAWGVAIISTGLLMAFGDVTTAYTLPTSWAVALLVGAAGYVYRERLAAMSTSTSAAAAAAGVGVLAAVTVAPIDLKGNPATYVVAGPFIALSTVAMIGYVSRWQTAPRLLGPLRWLGLVSYAAYLWNFPINHWIGNDFGSVSLVGAASIPLTIAAAVASYFLIERPATRRFRRHSDREVSAVVRSVPRHAVSDARASR